MWHAQKQSEPNLSRWWAEPSLLIDVVPSPKVLVLTVHVALFFLWSMASTYLVHFMFLSPQGSSTYLGSAGFHLSPTNLVPYLVSPYQCTASLSRIHCKSSCVLFTSLLLGCLGLRRSCIFHLDLDPLLFDSQVHHPAYMILNLVYSQTL
jgi:hypothetical protein